MKELEFTTEEEISGLPVGYDVDGADILERKFRGSRKEFIRAFCARNYVEDVARGVLNWAAQLQTAPNSLCLQFVPQRSLNGGFYARGIASENGVALLQLEFIPLREDELCMPVHGTCQDAIPHELMHIKDCREGRSPTMYPFAELREGAWIDTLRHFWIDGFLEQRQMPYIARDVRLAELKEMLEVVGKRLPPAELSNVANNWWGKPMTLRQAIEAGLGIGFPLELGCPLEHWYSASFSD